MATEAKTSGVIPQAKPSFQIVSAGKRDRYLNILFYGDYGVGKTSLAASAHEVEKMRDVLFIDVEAGSESIKHYSDLDVVEINSYSQFARVHEFLRLHCIHRDKGDEETLLKLERRLKGDDSITKPKKYRTVIIDTLTEVQKYCMYQLLGITVGTFQLDMEPENPQFAEWGRSAEMIRLLVRSFRDLPMHTIFVVHKQEEQDERKRFHSKPALPGKLANEVMGFVDIVGFMVAGQVEGGDKIVRRVWLEPGQTFKAKNRFRNFTEKYLDNPTMADFMRIRQL